MGEPCRVDCHSGHRYAEQPRAFIRQGKRYGVEHIERSWRNPEALVFIVVTHERERFRLTYVMDEDAWWVEPMD